MMNNISYNDAVNYNSLTSIMNSEVQRIIECVLLWFVVGFLYITFAICKSDLQSSIVRKSDSANNEIVSLTCYESA